MPKSSIARKRVAAYCRVSTLREDQVESFETQRMHCASRTTPSFSESKYILPKTDFLTSPPARREKSDTPQQTSIPVVKQASADSLALMG